MGHTLRAGVPGSKSSRAIWRWRSVFQVGRDQDRTRDLRGRLARRGIVDTQIEGSVLEPESDLDGLMVRMDVRNRVLALSEVDHRLWPWWWG